MNSISKSKLITFVGLLSVRTVMGQTSFLIPKIILLQLFFF